MNRPRTWIARSAVLPLVLISVLATAQRSPFNGLDVQAPAADSSFKLIFSGHFHGGSSNRTGLPAATVLANIDVLNATEAQALISTGDLFMDPAFDTTGYRRAFFDRLRLPLLNVVGNHDISGGHYQRLYGNSFSAFHIGEAACVLLDTERDNGGIHGEQLEALQRLVGHKGPVFIVSHRPVWAEDDPEYGPLFAGNTRSMLGTNYRKEVWPLVQAIAATAPLYWISGSMAGGAPASVFFQQHAPNITFVQSAIRDTPRDAVLLAEVGPEGVQWRMLPLTAKPVADPATYDAAFWKKHKGRKESFNWRLLPYLVKMTVTSKEFWWGVAAALLVAALLRRLLRRLW